MVFFVGAIDPWRRLPGAFAWGYIACTGTNFCLRVRALAHCGWFPEYTITEDYALGMELKSRGYKVRLLFTLPPAFMPRAAPRSSMVAHCFDV
jgi:cellulose synthase/poly-beta-1,6-N-acetylglucosamine synthase-like glycosyltransferase